MVQSNTYVVGPEESREAIVIDPARGAVAGVLAYVRSEQLEVTAIVCTHRHFDHVSGNAALKAATGASILAHEADAARFGRFSVTALLRTGKPAWSPKADRVLKDGDTVRAGAYEFEVIHHAGPHARRNLFEIQEESFTGDTLLAGSVGRTETKEGSWEQLSQSIQDRIYVLSDDVQCWPGHGPRTNIGRERRTNIFARHSPEVIERWLFGLSDRKRAAEEESPQDA
ncbi:MAG: MBL fold metallo-hydrolase [Deltaproteobacteria bacterium]|nr:MBL fold metallo-hydrolase [Deltaproteobacteria bacterium]